MGSELNIKVIKGEDLSEDAYQATVSLCSRAFWEDYEPFLKTIKNPIHLLGYADNMLVSHALWVTRWLQIDDGPALRTAYVEGVATEEAYRAKGFGTTMMKRIIEEIADYEIAALSPFSVAYYMRLGWELWHGPLYVRSNDGPKRTLRDGDVMIFRLPKTPELDVNSSLSVEWREGELW